MSSLCYDTFYFLLFNFLLIIFVVLYQFLGLSTKCWQNVICHLSCCSILICRKKCQFQLRPFYSRWCNSGSSQWEWREKFWWLGFLLQWIWCQWGRSLKFCLCGGKISTSFFRVKKRQIGFQAVEEALTDY